MKEPLSLDPSPHLDGEREDLECEARRWSKWCAMLVYKAIEIPLNPSRMSQPLSEADLKAIREEIFAGRMISAIKVYRQCTGLGLKEAKDAVEEMEKKLRLESPERFRVEQAEHGQEQEAKSGKSVPGVQQGKG